MQDLNEYEHELCKVMREAREALHAAIERELEDHMAKHYSDQSPLQRQLIKTRLKVDTWESWKPRRLHSDPR